MPRERSSDMTESVEEKVGRKLGPVVGFVERRLVHALKIGLPLLVFVWLIFSCSPAAPWLSLIRFEWQVKRHVDTVQLQQWATNLLAQHPGGYADNNPTNPPPGFDRVRGYWHGFRTGGGSTTSERCVLIGGGRTEPSLMVGSPTLRSTSPRAVPWKPGIYFLMPHEHE